MGIFADSFESQLRTRLVSFIKCRALSIPVHQPISSGEINRCNLFKESCESFRTMERDSEESSWNDALIQLGTRPIELLSGAVTSLGLSAQAQSKTRIGFVNQSISQMDTTHWYVGAEAVFDRWAMSAGGSVCS